MSPIYYIYGAKMEVLQQLNRRNFKFQPVLELYYMKYICSCPFSDAPASFNLDKPVNCHQEMYSEHQARNWSQYKQHP